MQEKEWSHEKPSHTFQTFLQLRDELLELHVIQSGKHIVSTESFPFVLQGRIVSTAPINTHWKHTHKNACILALLEMVLLEHSNGEWASLAISPLTGAHYGSQPTAADQIQTSLTPPSSNFVPVYIATVKRPHHNLLRTFINESPYQNKKNSTRLSKGRLPYTAHTTSLSIQHANASEATHLCSLYSRTSLTWMSLIPTLPLIIFIYISVCST